MSDAERSCWLRASMRRPYRHIAMGSLSKRPREKGHLLSRVRGLVSHGDMAIRETDHEEALCGC
jgi:hypothetical protein